MGIMPFTFSSISGLNSASRIGVYVYPGLIALTRDYWIPWKNRGLMGANGKLLATFADSLRNRTLDGKAIAAKLYGALQAQRDEAGILKIVWYGASVEMELANGEHWAIECIGPDAFRVYPGIVRQDTVTWLNLWVVADYTLEKMIEEVNRVTQTPANEK